MSVIPERVPMTREGFDKLRQEIEFLKATERPRILQELEEARAHGDLSENAEYHAARDKLAHVKGRLEDLEFRLSKAEIINPTAMKGHTKVAFGAHVTLVEVDEEQEVTYQIVGEYESDISIGKLSVTSPIARALIGRAKDSLVKVKTPKGEREFEIIEVEYK